jgi:hypothetical protein
VNFARRAYLDGYRAAWAKLGYDVPSNADDNTDVTPGRHVYVAASGPAEDRRRSSNIEMSFRSNATFDRTSPEATPGAQNASLNETVGPGGFANRTQSSGGAS